MKMRTIFIPKGTDLHWRAVKKPAESAAGIVDFVHPECEIDGHRYQPIDLTNPEVEGPSFYVIGTTIMQCGKTLTLMDMETAEIVELVFGN